MKEEFAGRRVKCPACGAVAEAGTSAPTLPLEGTAKAPAPQPEPSSARRQAVEDEPDARRGFDIVDDGDDRPRPRRPDRVDKAEDDDLPPRRRRRRRQLDDDEDDDRPRRRYRSRGTGNGIKRLGYIVGGVVLLLLGCGLAWLGWQGNGRGSGRAMVGGICMVICGFGTAFRGLVGNVDSSDTGDVDDEY